MDRDCKRQHPFCVFCKKKGHTKEQCRKLQRKEHNSKAKVVDHKGQILDVLEVYTHHFSCKFSFPHYVLGPNDLLRANGYINGSPVQFLFDSESSRNFVNDRLAQIWGIKPTVGDHTYKVHLAYGSAQYINGAIHSLGISIDTYVEEVDFHVMNLCTIDVTLGYPWFYNKNSSLSIDWVHHSITFVLNNCTHFI